MTDPSQKTRGLPSDNPFFTSLSIAWFALAVLHFFPTEIPFFDRVPGLSQALVLLSLACGCRLGSKESRTAWYTALAVICTLLLSCGFNVGVYPLVKTDGLSTSCAVIVAAIALAMTSFLFFKLGQLLNIQELSDRKLYLKHLSIGSLCGVSLYAVSATIVPGPGSLLWALLFFPGKPRLPIFVGALLIAMWCQSTTWQFVFSPYKKFEVKQLSERETMIYGDGLPYNFCVDIPDAERFAQFAQMAHVQKEIDTFRYYLGRLSMPLGLARRTLDDVLILGAGTGNDVSFALKNGAQNIDAVELDTTLVKLAEAKHPDKPFGSSNVRLYTEDPRSFLRHTNKKYDLIEFCYFNPGRSDSAPYAIKQDNFLNTTECFNLALKRLKPGGVIFVGFSAQGDSIAAARLHASVASTGEPAQVAYLQHDADSDPLATKYFFFGLGPGIKLLSKSDLEPLVTQFIHVTPFENIPTDEKGASDNFPFVRAEDREIQNSWIFGLAVASLSVLLPFYRKAKNQPFYLPPLCFGITLALANYLSFASFSLIAGFHWVTNCLLLVFNCLCFFACSQIDPSLKAKFSWLAYLISAVACGLVAGFANEPLVVCASENLLILTCAFCIDNAFERYDSPSLVVYFTLAGLTIGSVSAIVALYFGLSSLGIVGLISLVFAYTLEKRILKRSHP